MGHGDEPGFAAVVDELDGAAVGQTGDGEVDHLGQRGLQVEERRRQRRRRLGQEGQALLGPLGGHPGVALGRRRLPEVLVEGGAPERGRGLGGEGREDAQLSVGELALVGEPDDHGTEGGAVLVDERGHGDGRVADHGGAAEDGVAGVPVLDAR